MRCSASAIGTSRQALTCNPLRSLEVSPSRRIAVAGGRITTILSRKAFATVLGDAGGGSARSDYQVAGFLGYQISRRWVLLAGYRYLSVDYRPNGRAQFVYDVNMPGVVIGATFNAK